MAILTAIRASVYLCLLIGFYAYHLFEGLEIVKGKGKNRIFLVLLAFVFAMSQWVGYVPLFMLLIVLISELFVCFYNDEPFRLVWHVVLPPAAILFMGSLSQTAETGTLLLIAMLLTVFISLSHKRGYLKWENGLSVTAIYLVLAIVDVMISLFGGVMFHTQAFVIGWHFGIALLAMLTFMLLEMTLRSYERGFLNNSKELREQLLGQQYDEIQSIYLNMRGWRHDYHNHIQVLKATLEEGAYEHARRYLDTIEDELRRVDTYVKSGNVMADAILNSKLTLAERKEIVFNCDAFLPDQLFITDVDLCTILGNVLDNAIESCEKLKVSERFIRIYIALNKEQLYVSVQNASLEEIDFDQKHYISKKKGNHGLGMKRVAAVVDKWQGYLSLNQQPGVFATEIMIPLPDEMI